MATKPVTRNPNWTRDELVLAAEFYRRQPLIVRSSRRRLKPYWRSRSCLLLGPKGKNSRLPSWCRSFNIPVIRAWWRMS